MYKRFINLLPKESVMANSICCNQLPIRPERMHYSIPNKRMRVFNSKFDHLEIEIVELAGEQVIQAKSLSNLNTVTFKRDKHLKVLIGKNSVTIYDEVNRMSLSGITATGELKNLENMRVILKNAKFIE